MISTFQRYLSVWGFLCMGIGLAWGGISVNTSFLETLSIQGISIPIAVLIWIMIYPMMLKVDFNSINEVGCAPKGACGYLDCKLAD